MKIDTNWIAKGSKSTIGNSSSHFRRKETLVGRFARTSLLLLFVLCSAMVSAEQVQVTLTKAGTLSEKIDADQKYTITSLKVSGPINGTDVRYLREMAGQDAYGYSTEGKLIVLDMEDAKIVAGGEWYVTDGMGTFYTTSNNVMGNSTFWNCRELTDVILPSTVTLLDDAVFCNCYNLKSVTIPSTVTEIANKVFMNCYTLEKITIPSSVTRMRTYVFNQCYSLKSVTILADNLAMEREIFYGTTLTELVVRGKNMPQCDTETFWGCNLSNTILRCDPALIKQCTASPWSEFPIYANITLSSVDRLSNYITDATKYQVVNLKIDGVVNSEDTGLTSDMARNGKLSVLDMSDATTAPEVWWDSYHDCTGLTSISLPMGYTTIGGNAFKGCTGLKSIGIPSSVKDMGNYAFNGCSSLTDIELPSQLGSISISAFEGCTALKKVTIPEGVNVVWANAFKGCTGLTEIAIASGGTIYDKAFYGCTSLTKVTLLGNTLPANCAADAFDGGSSSDATLYCREPLYDDCRTNDPWNKFNDIQVWKWSVAITDAGMATACFDENLDVTSLGDEVKAYIATGFSPSSGKVLLTRVMQIPAGTGFILKGNEGTYEIPVSVTDYMYVNMLVGTLSSVNLSEITGSYTNYVLGNGDSGVGFYLPSTNCVVDANKAYLQIPTSAVSAGASEAKALLGLDFDDEDGNTTGFISVEELTEGVSGKSAIYNLNGQRKQSLTKGLNIVNGKKILIK